MLLIIGGCSNGNIKSEEQSVRSVTESVSEERKVALEMVTLPISEAEKPSPPEPTEAPTSELTEAPTSEPTEEPTLEPTEAHAPEPTEAPTLEPTEVRSTGSSREYAVNDKNGKIHMVGQCAATGDGKNAMKEPVYFSTYEEAEAYSVARKPSLEKRRCGNCW
ncbi:MAG: hypothetical protein IJN16_02440 [Lachnospiraceae bacterium]|nr:hypothetical protein [Lachnospiraceae bacterium]